MIGDKFKVYLGGPIKGLTYEGATTWRHFVADRLAPEIVVYSPLRAKKAVLQHLPVLDSNTHPVNHPLTTQKGIMRRDRWDVMTCDLLFVNFLEATEPSQGTDFEIAWAFDHDKPIVVAMQQGNPHWHPMVLESAGFILPTLEEAIHITKAILLPDSE